MNLIDEEYRVRVVEKLLQHGFEPLLEIAAVLGAGEQRAHVERIDRALGEDLRHVAFNDAPRQAFGNRGLAHTRLAHQQRIVLAPPAQRLHDALEFALAPDQRIDFSRDCERIQIERVSLERTAGRLLLLGLRFAIALAGRGLRHFADAVRNEIHDVQPRHAFLMQEINCVRIFFTENRDQHVGAGDFFLAGRLHVQNRALDHALEAERGLRVGVFGRQNRRVLGDELREQLAQVVDFRRAGFEHFGCRRIVEQREQQVLDGDEFMPLLTRLHERHVQADFEFLGDHQFSSITQQRGC